MDIRTIRENILTAREKRAFLRQQCSAKGHACLSLSLNIPGYPKCEPLFSRFFDAILTEFTRFLSARRIFIERDAEICASDEAGDFYLVPLSAGNRVTTIELKTLCERFEENHPVGRAIDIDVTNPQGQPVSSGKLKQCFLCDNPAIVCMREQIHSHLELRKQIALHMTTYLDAVRQEQTCKQLASIALKAALYEISVSPKPGLVDRFDAGAHQDMDYFTFLNSSAALSGYFGELAESGWTFSDGDLTQALPLIRDIGLKMESAMFEASGGINTQKGFIFLMGVSLFATSYMIARDASLQITACRDVIARICKNLVHNELSTDKEPESTHGARCFRHYGETCGGARQEAEEGFPTVFIHGLPALKMQLSSCAEPVDASTMNAALIHTLLTLMTVVNDTNILYRGNPETLASVKQMARHVLESEGEQEKASQYDTLIHYCRQEQISPGGAADLLAVTVFFYCVEAAFS